MDLLLLNTDELREQAVSNLGGTADPVVAIAELLRAELSAKTICSRRSLCDRTRRMLLPYAEVEIDLIRQVLEDLERTGDATFGPRGMIAASPLRVVSIGDGGYLVRGTIPTRKLKRHSVFNGTLSAVNRSVSLTADHESELAAAVRLLGGLKMDASRWAGLDRIDKAGPDWLAVLDARLEAEGVSAASLADEIVGKWHAYQPSPNLNTQQSRWKGNDDYGQLWQAKHASGWRIYVWTGGKSPNKSRLVRLTEDEAIRAVFSLDIVASLPLTVSRKVDSDFAELQFGGRFPLAEYRYLTTMGDSLGYLQGQARYRIRKSVVGDVANVVTERLGVIVASSEGTQ